VLIQGQRIPITTLGEPGILSPLRRSRTPGEGVGRFVSDDDLIRELAQVPEGQQKAEQELLFEKAGARERIFFDPARTRAAIVTCGGLCPGLNNVIRSVFLELNLNYGVKDVFGIRYGYRGLNPDEGEPPVRLTLEMLESIHEEGGTILGSSRGSQEAAVMADFLERERIDMLFCVGGDGTQRGAHELSEEIRRRGLSIAVVGIPKTIDNDIPYCETSFGLVTAVEKAREVLQSAHVEARGALNGIGLVKVMGRGAGFIAAAATLASQQVNFTVIPEVPFALRGEGGFLAVLRERILARRHAVIVVAEGAGQDLLANAGQERDASGNIRLGDIGLFLKGEISAYFAEHGPKVDVKYIDPSYIIRSVPANAYDSYLCDQLARRAVHAAMAGKTDVLICPWRRTYIHVPIPMATAQKQQVDVEGEMWTSVLSATGQPIRLR